MATEQIEHLEQLFQKVEEETERRAIEAELRDLSRAPSPMASTVVIYSATANTGAGSSTATEQKQRRRGSVSISRFGQSTEPPVSYEPVLQPISRPGSKLSHLALASALYAQPQTESVDSFGSDTGETHPIEDHVTQMQHISGKQSISRAVAGKLTRGLSRSNSRNDLKVVETYNVVIGVAVEEATVEHEPSTDTEEEASAQATVEAAIKKMPSKKSLSKESSWLNKATRVFRRKSRTQEQLRQLTSPEA